MLRPASVAHGRLGSSEVPSSFGADDGESSLIIMINDIFLKGLFDCCVYIIFFLQ